jgi:hypothetical protein
MGEPMQPNGMALVSDSAKQAGMPMGLVGKAEPSGPSPRFRAKGQSQIRGQRQTTLELVQSIRLIIGRAAELEPILPIEGEWQSWLVQVKFRSERLMNSREKSSSSVWNCFS